MKCALFVDISNLYYCVGQRFDSRRVDYEKFLDRVKQIYPISRAFAYGAQRGSEAADFVFMLKKIGYETKYKAPRLDLERGGQKAGWEVGMTIDVVKMIDRLDVVVLASSSPDFLPLIQWIKEQVHCKVVIVACGIPRELREAADQWFEIDRDLLEEVKGNGNAA